MEKVFLTLLNMSITASWMVLAILVLRLIFRKAPKWTFCVLWGLVAIRLMLPFSMESVLSLVPSGETVPLTILETQVPVIQSGSAFLDTQVNQIISEALKPDAGASVNPAQVTAYVMAVVWLVGMIAMIIYAEASYLHLRLRLRTSVPVEKNIRKCDAVQSPFVLGIVRPVIYLPFGMEEAVEANVLAHENAHIARRDHWWKPLGFLLLSVYWFNPVLWVAYILLCRDIEAACDEKVIKSMDHDKLVAYSEALLSCSVKRSSIKACPVAFGETNVKSRIASVMSYKKPAFWLIIASIVVCAVVAVCFLTNPVKDKNPNENDTPGITPSVGVTQSPGPVYEGVDLTGYQVYAYSESGANRPVYIALDSDNSFLILLSVPDSRKGGFGTYERDGDTIILYDDSLRGQGSVVYRFTLKDDELIFDKEHSDKFGYCTLNDGDRFVLRTVDPHDIGYVNKGPRIDGTVFSYGGKSFDLKATYTSITGIEYATVVGDKVLIECHVGPNNGLYVIYDTVSDAIVKAFGGHHLRWYWDDLNTAVYMFWDDVCNIDGKVLKKLTLGDFEQIYDLTFSDDKKNVEITIFDYEKEKTRTETVAIK